MDDRMRLGQHIAEHTANPAEREREKCAEVSGLIKMSGRLIRNGAWIDVQL